MDTLPALAVEHSAPALPAADLEAAAAFARQEKAPATRAAYRSAPEASTRCRRALRAWRPIWRTKPRRDRPQAPSPAAALPSGTPIALPTWSHRLVPSTFAPRSVASAAPLVQPRCAKHPCWPSRPALWPCPPPRASRAPATGHCYCWASQARFAGPSSWRSTSPTSRKPRTASRLPSAAARPTRKATASRSRSSAGTTPARSRPSRRGCRPPASPGPLFRPVAKGGRLGVARLTDKSVCNLVKAYAERIGLEAADFSAHSLRAGFLTSAARRGASVFKMRDVSRHKSMDVLQAYVRDADLFRDHAGAGLL
jgi:hypothetical protein